MTHTFIFKSALFLEKVLYFPKKVLYFTVFLRKIGVRSLLMVKYMHSPTF